ncbi:MAG: alpha/beta fold hydrolase [Rhodospirillales bacterium]|nr:alpha/beta fold hydrolase [Rhodospirillales bacterium]
MPDDSAAAPGPSKSPKPSSNPQPAAPPATKARPPAEPPGAQMPFPAATESIDRVVHAVQGRLTSGMAPAATALAFFDWLVHLANSPGKMNELAQNAYAKSLGFALYAARNGFRPGQSDAPFITPLPGDTRFASDEWRKYPFNMIHQAFLLGEQWWNYATKEVRGVSRHHQDMVGFSARQFWDMIAPSNYLLTNPDLVKTTLEQGGANLARGYERLLADAQAALSGQPPKPRTDFAVGKNLAVTPGKVVLKNRLIELIQYTPSTPTVHPEPVLIVPAWIMKYYILDLQPQNSLIKYLVDQGHTVFAISWKNPDAGDRDLGLEDYRELGVEAALQAIDAIAPGRKVHGVGYCLGGTLLSIATAAMARDGRDRLASLTLLAAQVDFEEAGEIMLFIDESQLLYLEDMMWEKGFLDTKQMAGAFQMLRSKDLVWSRLVRNYLLGEDETLNDMMTWNADATRMPYRMHSDYLRHLFLDNALARGKFQVGGKTVALTDIRVPILAVGTTTDHVAPWKSVYKIRLLTDTEVTFVLTSGGHNAGIVSEPGRPRRSHQIATAAAGDKYIDPDAWAQATPKHEGSWWPAWQAWLAERSGAKVPPPATGNAKAGYAPLYDAPGTYVLQP